MPATPVKKRQPAEKPASRVFEDRNQAFRILHETFLEVEGADEEKLFSILCRNLLRLTGGRFAACATYNPNSRSLTLQSACRKAGSGRISAVASSHRNNSISRATIRSLREKKVVRYAAAPEFLAKLLPAPALKYLHRETSCYRFSCSREGELLAVALLQLPAGEKLPRNDMLDTYLGLTALLIQRRHAFHSLQKSEGEMSLILESLDELITFQDRKFRIIWANRAAAESVGKKTSELIGRFCYEVWHGRDRACDPCPVAKAISTGKSQKGEVTTPDGRGWLIGGYPVRDRKGNITGAVEITREVTERKRRESELAHHDLVYRSMQEAVLTFDRQGRIVDANPATENILGWSREELRGRKAEMLNPPRRARPLTAEILRSLKEKGDWKGKLPIVTRSGELRHMSTIISSLRDQSGNWIGNIGINRDITDRVAAEEALARQERHYRTLFNTSPSPISLVNGDGKIVNVNTAFCEVTGYSRKEVLGLEVRNFSVSDSAKDIKKNIHRILAGETLRHIVINRRKDGTECSLDLNETRITLPDGKPGILCISADVTEKMKAEAALRESEERFRTIFETAEDSIFIKDHRGVYTLINPAMGRLFGRPPSEMIGKNDKELFGVEGSRAIREVDRRVLQGEIINTEDRQVIRGTTHDFQVIKIPLRDVSGKITGLYGIARDITGYKRRETERLKLQKLESLGLLAGGIAHDFNNLLMAIMGNISIAKLKAGGGREANKFLDEAEASCLRARNLTQQLLTFSRGGKPITAVISLDAILREATRFALSGSKTKAKFSIANDLWKVKADQGQIHQVINNLVINADQATPGGGVIEIGARNLALDGDSGLPLPPGRYLLLTVRDRGTGIPKIYLNRVFDPYFTTKKKGSGLGLATSFSIIKNHSGLITVNSVEGEETTFSIYLPVTVNPSSGAQENPEEVIRGRGRILLMDDDRFVIQVMGKMTEYLGYDTVTAFDGAEAIRKYREARKAGRPFDVVVLDLTVPGGMGGRETMREWKKIDPEVTALVSSGYSTTAAMAEFRRYGFRGVIRKPYTLAKLGKILRRATARKK